MLSKLRKLVPDWVFHIYHWLRAVVAIIRYGYPARDLFVIGVTGTDGKTTTCHMIYSILKAAGLPASLISTTGAIITTDDNIPTGLHVTTPNPFQLQRLLKEARDTGSKYVVLEATSHGLAQNRVMGSNFQIGVITNITHEHLDYHKTWENYFLSKVKLLRRVKTSILNLEDPGSQKAISYASGKLVTYGLTEKADIQATNIVREPTHTTFLASKLNTTIRSPFLGGYNVYNLLAAIAVGMELGIEGKTIAKGLRNATPPPGRLQLMQEEPVTVYVDFAHTPNSLENVLALLSDVAEQRLIAVFGCAGERDVQKRFPMGTSAGKHADITVITAEDPRTENLDAIMDDVAEGVESEGGIFGETYFRVHDRQAAIEFAIQELAQPGDIVVTCGKAHEQSLCFGTIEYPWDEFNAVKNALSGKKTNSGLPTAQPPTA